jgi:hypothetical protein
VARRAAQFPRDLFSAFALVCQEQDLRSLHDDVRGAVPAYEELERPPHGPRNLQTLRVRTECHARETSRRGEICPECGSDFRSPVLAL